MVQHLPSLRPAVAHMPDGSHMVASIVLSLVCTHIFVLAVQVCAPKLTPIEYELH